MAEEAKTIGQRTWDGDSSVTTLARRRAFGGLSALLENEVLPYASTLYSLIREPGNADELLWIRPRLWGLRARFVDSWSDDYFASHWADRTDMLTTYFAWYCGRKEIPEPEKERMRKWTLHILQIAGMRLSGDTTAAPHTRILMTLTKFSFLPPSTGWFHSLDALGHQASRDVLDPNQLARIYRRIGMRYRQIPFMEYPIKAFGALHWGIRACFVPGSTRNVRLKSLVALLGF